MTNLMKKFLLFSALVCAILFTSSAVYAANTAGDVIQNVGNGVRNFVGGAENAIENGVKDVGDAVQQGVNGLENTMNANDNTQTTNNNNNMKANNNGTTYTGNTDGYTATRTTTDTNVGIMSGTAWTWIILAIAAVLIIGLVWYYSAQNNVGTDQNDRRN